MATPSTVLLLIPQDLHTYALAVSDILLKRFGVLNVLIRSSQTPPDRLLDVSNTDKPLLFVVLGHSTASTSVLETDSAAPIITLSSNVDVQSTALSIAKCCSLSSSELRERVQKVVFANRQARLVQDAQLRTSSARYVAAIGGSYDHKLQITGDNLGTAEHRGKVRDRYPAGPNLLALVTTDRQSGFDRMLAQVPFKGAVLNMTSAFWFEQTKHIIPNHLVSVPHPYISVCRKCKPFPIEFVVRYVSGGKHYFDSNSYFVSQKVTFLFCCVDRT